MRGHRLFWNCSAVGTVKRAKSATPTNDTSMKTWKHDDVGRPRRLGKDVEARFPTTDWLWAGEERPVDRSAKFPVEFVASCTAIPGSSNTRLGQN
jgi:hypothetical protein